MRMIGARTLLLVALASVSTHAAQDVGACNLACEKGQTCKLQEVQCITAPCDPVPTCVPNKTKVPQAQCTKVCPKDEKCMINSMDNSQYCLTPCATVRCASGYTCQVQQVQCIRAPCPPVAVCKRVKSPYGQRVLRIASDF